MDIEREIKNMYCRTNHIARKFSKCSRMVKIRLFRCFYICLYGTALWHRFSKSSLLKFKFCYNKCLKFFFGYRKFSSVTEVLMDVGLPCFDTMIHNYKHPFDSSTNVCSNVLIVHSKLMLGLFCS